MQLAKTVLISAFIGLLFASTKLYAQLYVAPTGNDSNAGTSISNAFATIQHAATVATPGTTVYISAGTYHERIYNIISGLPGQEITFKNYQQDEVFIDPSGTSGFSIWAIYGPSYINLIGLHFNYLDTTAQSYQAGVVIGAASNHISVSNCTFTGMRNRNSTGILIYGTDTTKGVHDILLSTNEIGDTTFHMNSGIAANGNAHHLTIEKNKIHHCRYQGIVITGADSVCAKPQLDYVRNCTISENTINNIYNKISGTYQNGILIGACRNNLIVRNTIHHCDMGISLTAYRRGGICNANKVNNNQIYGCFQQGLNMGVYGYPANGRVYNCEVANNTFYQNNSESNNTELTYFPFDSCKIVNNIFYANTNNTMLYAYFYDSIFTQNQIDYNLYCSPINNPGSLTFYWANASCSSLGYYKMISNQDLHSIYAEPHFIDANHTSPDFRLYDNSPAINAALPAWNNSGSIDLEGQSRVFGGQIDIGCDENHNDHPVPQFASLQLLGLSQVQAFPNPATATITFQAALQSISLLNSSGVNCAATFQTQSNGATVIDVHALAAGEYIISAFLNGQHLFYRFVKI